MPYGLDKIVQDMGQIKNMGGISSIMSMMPGLSGQMKNVSIDDDEAEKNMRRSVTSAISTPAPLAILFFLEGLSMSGLLLSALVIEYIQVTFLT